MLLHPSTQARGTLPNNMADIDVNNLLPGCDYCLDSVYSDYPKSCFPQKLKKSSTDKAKSVQYERIDEYKYEDPAHQVAFRVTLGRLVPWIKALQLLYYEYYGSSAAYDVDWYDSPKDWTKNGTGNKMICIELSTKEDIESENPLLYKITLFITTGFVQVQGNHKDRFAAKDFHILRNILKTVLEVNKLEAIQDETTCKAPAPNETTCKAPAPNPENDPDQEIQVEDNGSSDLESPIEDIYENELEQTILKEPVQSFLKETEPSKQTINDNDQSKDTGSRSEDSAVAPYVANNTDKYLEKLESHFTSALEKICTQQNELFNSKFQSMEMYYRQSIETNERHFKQILDTVKSVVKVPETDKLQNRILALEKENVILKSSVQELKSTDMLNNEIWRTKNTSLETQIGQQKQTYEKTVRDLQKEVTALRTQVTEKESAMEETMPLRHEIQSLRRELDQRDGRIKDMESSIELLSQTNDFQEVRQKRTTARDRKQVVVIGTSNTEGIDPSKLSTKFDTNKITAYTLEQTQKEVRKLNTIPDVIVLHSLTNDLETLSYDVCIGKLNEIVEAIHHSVSSEVNIIISLPTPRGDSDSMNNKAQILGLMIKEEFKGNSKVSFCDNSNMAYKGSAIGKFLQQRDKKHLSNSGIAMLAANIRDAIDKVLGLPNRLQKAQEYGNGRPDFSDSRYYDQGISDSRYYDQGSSDRRYSSYRGNYHRGGSYHQGGRGQGFRGHSGRR